MKARSQDECLSCDRRELFPSCADAYGNETNPAVQKHGALMSDSIDDAPYVIDAVLAFAKALHTILAEEGLVQSGDAEQQHFTPTGNDPVGATASKTSQNIRQNIHQTPADTELRLEDEDTQATTDDMATPQHDNTENKPLHATEHVSGDTGQGTANQKQASSSSVTDKQTTEQIATDNDQMTTIPPPIDLPLLTPERLLNAVQNVEFVGHTGEVKFDANGDVKGGYLVTNMRTSSDNNYSYKYIGAWNGRPAVPVFTLHVDQIEWPGHETSVPFSACSRECQPGYRMVYGQKKCCWDCVRCPIGSITSEAGQAECTKCSELHSIEFTSTTDGSSCVQLHYVYLRSSDPEAVLGMCVAVVGVLLSVMVLIVFGIYRDTPVVKSSNRELSFLLLAILTASFILPFMYIGESTDFSCTVQPVFFGIVYTICNSILLAKTYHYIRIFNLKTRAVNATVHHKQGIIVLCLSGIEVLMLVAFLIASTPYAQKAVSLDKEVQVYCSAEWVYLQAMSMAYISALGIVCTVLAFKARKLPENFNETKHISLTMLSLNLVWIASISAYFGVSSKTRSCVLCLCVNAASIFILVCMFFPRVFIIFFHADKNTPEYVQTVTMRHTMASTMRSISEGTRMSTASKRSDSYQSKRQSNSSASKSETTNSGSNSGSLSRQISMRTMLGVAEQNEGPAAIETEADSNAATYVNAAFVGDEGPETEPQVSTIPIPPPRKKKMRKSSLSLGVTDQSNPQSEDTKDIHTTACEEDYSGPSSHAPITRDLSQQISDMLQAADERRYVNSELSGLTSMAVSKAGTHTNPTLVGDRKVEVACEVKRSPHTSHKRRKRKSVSFAEDSVVLPGLDTIEVARDNEEVEAVVKPDVEEAVKCGTEAALKSNTDLGVLGNSKVPLSFEEAGLEQYRELPESKA
ncbi:PREDICTED: extracellular calcium-sensing receptor-like [Priapulus caudatus]|uniref:Extracellular calcium-sensing receptor-like n=1 Tax=Priapulus caudatus TaxID=37621 RepID=A0ABM1E8A4_PRICU|nr:PREDICTED: extracellular calcium-sensing receptor-like [Priapulus caudatus]